MYKLCALPLLCVRSCAPLTDTIGRRMTEEIANHYRQIITALGEDPQREGLQDTPMRAAKAMQFLTHGYHQSLEEIVNGAVFTSDTDEMVLVKDIELYSMCEHHMLPFWCDVSVILNSTRHTLRQGTPKSNRNN